MSNEAKENILNSFKYFLDNCKKIFVLKKDVVYYKYKITLHSCAPKILALKVKPCYNKQQRASGRGWPPAGHRKIDG